jgi:putative lipoic acid-binding regulatory protein
LIADLLSRATFIPILLKFEPMTEELLTFPCDFPLKVMGRAGDEFEGAVLSILRRHVPDLSEGAITIRASSGGNYSALSIVVCATSRAQLDALYRDLTGSPHVVMAL